MNIVVYMTEEEYSRIESMIDCESWQNPEEDLFIFLNPSERFRLLLSLNSIPFDITE